MNAHRNGDIVFNILIVVIIAVTIFLWYVVKKVKTQKQKRVFAAVFLAIVSYAMFNLWSFSSPDARGSEPREAFELWRILVSFLCLAGGIPAIIALVANHKENNS